MTTPQDSSPNPGAHGRTSGSTGVGSAVDSRTGQGTEDMAARAQAEGKAQVQRYRDEAADKVDRVADSVDAAAEHLRGDRQTAFLSHHVEDMAGSLGRLSSGLRQKSADEILADVGRIARDNPALFVAGSVALGFGIARFARASSDARHEDERRAAGRRTDRGHAQAGHGMTSHIPGTVGNPVTDQEHVDTTAPHGQAATTRAVPGPVTDPDPTAGGDVHAAGAGKDTPSGRI